MSINTELFENVCLTPGAPGFEDRIRNLVISEIKNLVDEYHIDNIGNVICFKKGRSDKKVLVAAHMDEISFIVKHIDENGFIKFQTLGGFDPKTLTAQKVIVHGKDDLPGVMGTKPIHVMTEEEKKKLPKIKDYYIDVGMPKEEVEKCVSIGDPVTRKGELLQLGNHLSCKSVDNRASVFLLIETLKNLEGESIPFDLYAVFSAQEEVGLRGASTAAHQINPDFGIAVDTTIAFDTPGASAQEMITKLGDGAAVKVMDSATICDQRMVQFMKNVAGQENIQYQMEVLSGGATDTAMLQRMGKEGSIAGAISIPTRNMHQVIEMLNKDDLENAIKLMTACLKQMDRHEWERKVV